jgi:MFS family permease
MGFPWLNRDLFWLFVLRVLRSFAQGYLGVITPLYVVMLGYNAVDLGILFAVSAIVSGVLSTLTGVMSDRFGRKVFLALISILTAIGAVWFALTRNFAMIVAAGALGSIGRGGAIAGGAWGPFYPAAQALVAEQTSDYHRTTVFGALSFVGVMAAAIGSLLAALPAIFNRVLGLPVLDGYRILFALAGLLALAMAVAVIPVRELHVGRGRAAGAGGEHEPHRAGAAPLLFGLSGESWQLVWRFMVTNATNGLAIGMLGPFVVYWFYRRFAVSATQLGELFFVLNLVSSIPYLMAGRIAMTFGAVRSVVVTRAISTALLFGVVLMPTFLTAAMLYTVRMIFNVISLPVRQSYLMGVIDPAERASAAALGNLPSQITSAAGPYFAGYFMEHLSLALPLEFAAVMQALNALLYWLFFRKVFPPEEADSFAAGN